MKHQLKNFMLITTLVLATACGSNNASEDEEEYYDPSTSAPIEEAGASSSTGLANKGIGPVNSITLNDEIDQGMVTKGKEIFDAKCTACHKAEKKHIGPSPTGVLTRRSPEWVMNMILNPEVMIAEDPDAMALLQEYNNAPMANQNLTEAEARSILEYFRTLK